MASKHDEPIDPNAPALVVLYGSDARRIRALGRDVTVIGKARGCDVVLDAHDVSTVHCVITRRGDGLRLRDCDSRAGTRLNGETIDEAALSDDDLLQIGPFSFRVRLPAPTARDRIAIGAAAEGLGEQAAA